jgi:hypothetical protein
MTQQEIEDIIAIKQGAIENLLKKVYLKLNSGGNRYIKLIPEIISKIIIF